MQRSFRSLAAMCTMTVIAACSPPAKVAQTPAPMGKPDPRVGLKAGLMDAGEAVSNLRINADRKSTRLNSSHT